MPTESKLYVDDVLSAAPAVREMTVRSVGPAIAFIVEIDAPPQLLHNAETTQEREALSRFLEDDLTASWFSYAYSTARATSEGEENVFAVGRATRHAARLAEAIRG